MRLLQFLTVICGVQRADGIRLAAVSHCLVSTSISFTARVASINLGNESPQPRSTESPQTIKGVNHTEYRVPFTYNKVR